jgi:UPF0755 protein
LKKWILALLISSVTVFSVGAYLYYDLFQYALTPGNTTTQEAAVLIPQGKGFRAITENLVTAGVVKDPLKFRIYARIKGYDKKIKAGEYLLSAAMSPAEILQVLMSGKVRLYKITVPEGYTLQQIAALLAKAGLMTEKDFMAAATDPALVRAYGINAGTFEGYLFPDTYYFPKDIPPDKIISKMVDRFWEQFQPKWKARAEQLGFSVHKTVTLASIIEKETGVPFERAMISSVFHNRLKKRMRLESDPTVIYGVKDFAGNLTRQHLKTPSPYNTYLIRGLPPAPIANPGSAAINAALYPADTPYFYFVSKKDRTHKFSSTIDEHNRAVRKYQLGK